MIVAAGKEGPGGGAGRGGCANPTLPLLCIASHYMTSGYVHVRALQVVRFLLNVQAGGLGRLGRLGRLSLLDVLT